MEPTGHAYLDDRPGPLAFAHRGGAKHPDLIGLENTALAFRHAVALGYDYLETDVHLTSDGSLLAFHDPLLDRVTDLRGAISHLTYDEVRAARIGGTESVPLLAELLEAFPEARFNVDLKSDEAVEGLASLVEERGWGERILVGSFSGRRLRRFRRRTHGRVATSAGPLEVLAFLVLPARLARRVTRCDALQVPHTRGPLVVAGTRLLRRAHAVGVPVHVWTIDDPDEMRALLDRGVDGLMTDRTDILKAVLVERGQWRGRP